MIPIFKPYMPENILNGAKKILYSGNLSYGIHGRKFEKTLSEYIGCKNLLSVSTYNQAMLIILSTLGLNQGDEVIASPISCLASNQPFAIKGLNIVWADVNPLTGSLCIEDVKSKISTNTKAIFHNHYCGFLGEIDALNSLGREYGIPVIDDCIEAFGSELNNKKAGNLGTDISVFSFHSVRLPNTIDGGALVFKNDELYNKAKKIRDYGIDRSKFRDNLNEINPNCDVTLEGYGALMNEFNSYIGLKQINVIGNLIEKQRNNAKIWNKIISNKYAGHISSIKLNKDSSPNYWVYGIFSDTKIQTIKMFRKMGFYATSVHINNNIYSIFKNNSELKGVSEFQNKFIAIPSGWWLDSNLIFEKN